MQIVGVITFITRCDYIVLQCVNGERLGTRDHAADTDTGGYSRENVTGARPAFPHSHKKSVTKVPGFAPENNPRGGGKQRRLINATNRC